MTRALRSRNYRLFFFGQGVSLIGTWLTRVATSWLVYRLTSSAFLLGITGFAGQLPTFVLAPFAGVIVDRTNRHRVLLVTQVLSLAQSAALAFLTIRGMVTIQWVLVLAAAQGIINAFDAPARQSFVVEMVEDRADLGNAIALNSLIVNGARLLGPSLAGVLIATVGEGYCFAIDAASYVAVIGSLLAMRVALAPARRAPARFRSDLAEGLRYAAGFRPIRAILLLLCVVGLTGMSHTVLMPVVADRVLGGGPHTLGILMASSGVGALVAALWLAGRATVLGLGRVLVVAGAAFGGGLLLFAASSSLWTSVPLLVVTGAGMMLQMSAGNTLLQTLVDERMRGRVMSLFTVAVFGMAPFGSLAAGLLGARFGAPVALAAGGVFTLVAVAVFAWRLPALRAQARPVYEKLGIVPAEPSR